jgi:hypothetical protein
MIAITSALHRMPSLVEIISMIDYCPWSLILDPWCCLVQYFTLFLLLSLKWMSELVVIEWVNGCCGEKKEATSACFLWWLCEQYFFTWRPEFRSKTTQLAWGLSCSLTLSFGRWGRYFCCLDVVISDEQGAEKDYFSATWLSQTTFFHEYSWSFSCIRPR